MVATVILGMLCVHLLCFCVMFWLISTRLHGRKMGMGVFALGNLILGCAYILQLLDKPENWSGISVINHTLTLCAPTAYALGAMRFFNRPTPLLYPMLLLAAGYTTAQLLVQWALGSVARYVLLAGSCSLLFLAMTLAALYGMRSFAKDLRGEMLVFAVLIAGICGMNVAKLVLILSSGLPALHMSSSFQTVFYIYMSFLATVLPPCVVWLVLRRLTEELQGMASQDPLTKLLNRRGLQQGLEAYFRTRSAGPVHVLLIDIDHFKQVNDRYGHKMGDLVLCRVAEALQATARQGDLAGRLGGEEFVVACMNTDSAGALQLAERLRMAIAQAQVPGPFLHGPIRCTATIGISESFDHSQALELAMQQADVALYRGKTGGRNCVEQAQPELFGAEWDEAAKGLTAER